MTESIAIRPATEGDRPTVLAFLTALSDYELPLYDGLREGADCAEEYFETTSRAVENNNALMLIAEKDGRPAGFIWFCEEMDDDVLLREDARRHGYITDLFVLPEFRGQGVARALMAAVEQRCRALGLDRLRVGAIGANQPARRFYEARGYVPVIVTHEKRLNET